MVCSTSTGSTSPFFVVLALYGIGATFVLWVNAILMGVIFRYVIYNRRGKLVTLRPHGKRMPPSASNCTDPFRFRSNGSTGCLIHLLLL